MSALAPAPPSAKHLKCQRCMKPYQCAVRLACDHFLCAQCVAEAQAPGALPENRLCYFCVHMKRETIPPVEPVTGRVEDSEEAAIREFVLEETEDRGTKTLHSTPATTRVAENCKTCLEKFGVASVATHLCWTCDRENGQPVCAEETFTHEGHNLRLYYPFTGKHTVCGAHGDIEYTEYCHTHGAQLCENCAHDHPDCNVQSLKAAKEGLIAALRVLRDRFSIGLKRLTEAKEDAEQAKRNLVTKREACVKEAEEFGARVRALALGRKKVLEDDIGDKKETKDAINTEWLHACEANEAAMKMVVEMSRTALVDKNGLAVAAALRYGAHVSPLVPHGEPQIPPAADVLRVDATKAEIIATQLLRAGAVVRA